MVNHAVLVPMQIRAGRALLGWTQTKLAEMADIALSTVRDIERERGGGQRGGSLAIRRSLEAHGVIFLEGDGDQLGPGVRLRATVPNVIQLPASLGKWNDLLVRIEWQGQESEVHLSFETLQSLGEFADRRPYQEYMAIFNHHRSAILCAAAQAINTGRMTPDRRVHLEIADIHESNR